MMAPGVNFEDQIEKVRDMWRIEEIRDSERSGR